MSIEHRAIESQLSSTGMMPDMPFYRRLALRETSSGGAAFGHPGFAGVHSALPLQSGAEASVSTDNVLTRVQGSPFYQASLVRSTV